MEISEKYIDKFLIELRKGSDVVIAQRKYKSSFLSFQRFILSKCYVYLERVILAVPFRDTEAGYKFFNKSKIIPILKQTEDRKWFWDTEVVVRSLMNNLVVKEIPVIFTRRRDKKSTVKIVSDTIYYFRTLIEFKKKMNISSCPALSMILCYRGSFRGSAYAFLKSFLFPIKEISSFIPRSGIILDIGCAEGTMSNFISFARPNAKIIGIDLSNTKINKAKSTVSKRKNINFVKDDALTYNFPKSDAIIASDFLHHLDIQKQDKLLKIVSEALNRNGVFIIKDVDKSSKLRGTLSRFWDFVFYPGDRIYYRSKSEWVNSLKKMGLDASSKKTSFLSPFSTTLIIGRKI